MRKNKQKGLVLLLRSKQLLLYCFSIYTESVEAYFFIDFLVLFYQEKRINQTSPMNVA